MNFRETTMRRATPFAVAVLLLLALGLRADEPKLTRFHYEQAHMGTKFSIDLFADDEETAIKASKTAFARIAELDAIMSDYRPASELMQLCAKSGGDPVKVSDDLWTVLERAQQVAKQSDGAFD